MRKLFFVPAILLVSLTACNSGSNSHAAGADSTATATAPTDTMNMQHASATDSVAPLPAIPAGAKVYFKNLKDGQTVSSPVKIEFGVDKMTVIPKAPAGKIAEGFGHHHLLIDAGDSIPSGQIIPEDSTHLHYGKGQTDATISLTPGKHTLTMQFGDAIHRSYGGALATTITVTVR